MDMVDYTYIAPHGAGWLKANDSALGSGLWVKTTGTGVILPDDEIPGLISALQDYMSRRARDQAADTYHRIREMQSGVKTESGDRLCARCGDSVAYLSSDDLCDG